MRGGRRAAMVEDEVVVVHNCRRYVTYRGQTGTSAKLHLHERGQGLLVASTPPKLWGGNLSRGVEALGIKAPLEGCWPLAPRFEHRESARVTHPPPAWQSL